ncbi:hypothetical protein OO184_16880 [Photorhabdus sp. APURE]|nr:hypothetical protein [Photorhabdus aballayi]MCW7549565.1 hypothetical protein [Photorhabdus aballayi]
MGELPSSDAGQRWRLRHDILRDARFSSACGTDTLSQHGLARAQPGAD